MHPAAGADLPWANTTVAAQTVPPAALPAGAGPLQVWPRSTFRYRTCDPEAPHAFLRADRMPVPGARNGSAAAAGGNLTYAMHAWVRVSHSTAPPHAAWSIDSG
jgi:hypothetical protein